MFASSYSLSLSLGTGKKNKRQEQVQYSSTKTPSDWSKSCVFKIKNRKKNIFMEISKTKQNLYCPTSPYSSILPGPPHLPHRVHVLYSFLLLLVFDGNYLLFCYKDAFTYFMLLSFTFCVSVFLLELVMTKK